jgi:hypothetical protein
MTRVVVGGFDFYVCLWLWGDITFIFLCVTGALKISAGDSTLWKHIPYSSKNP